jgi:hypothetical protein
MFIVFVTYAARAMAARPRLCGAIVVLTCIGSATVVFGPVSGRDAHAAWVYHRFYRHGAEGSMHEALKTYGRRPYSFCH